ncbi:MAG: hypothetical protein WCK03_03690 [Candidatus Taylorbacteria bacterium]
MISQGQCTVFKTNLLSGLENFAAGTTQSYKIALYTGNASLDNSTAVYTASNEVTGSGYTAGGKTLTISQVPVGDTTNNTSYISFADVVWNPASFTARAALIYNSTTGAAVAVLDFGSDKTNTAAGTFTVTFPTATSTTSILRIS